MRNGKKNRVLPVYVIFCSLILFVFCRTGNAAEYAYTQGGKYTPMGAIAAGSEDGQIPPYEGGKALKCPKGWEKGDFYESPWPNEKPLFRIDHTNVDKYKDRLTPGQVMWLKKVPDRFMNIYPTHRVHEYPEIYYKASEQNLKTCYVDEKHVLQGHNGGVPFLFPKTGEEMAWNIKRPWAGPDLIDDSCLRIVSPKGKIRKHIRRAKIMAMGKHRLVGEYIPNPQEYVMFVLVYALYPPDQRGEIFLIKRYLDDNKESDVWQYMPSLRRVKRAPSLKDSRQTSGEKLGDEGTTGYTGKVRDWNWKLLPRRPIYIPADNYDLWKVDATDEEECWVGTPNPERFRYELHRCWVLEATVAEGYKHPYQKRVYYIDEDTMFIAVQDMYDKRGNLWRHMEIYNEHGICTNYRFVHGDCTVNLESLRYEFVGGGRNKDTKTNMTDIGFTEEDFSVQTLRNLGR